MYSRAAALLLLLLAASPAARAFQEDAPSPTPGLYTRTLQFMHLKRREAAPAPADEPQNTVRVRDQLELKLDLSPLPVKLSTTRQLKVTLALFNRGKKYTHLDFPTTQRIEILLINNVGKTVTQWSEDQSFTNDPASVTVNPNERVEYTASLSTREMTAGQSYTVQAYFPNFQDLKIQQQVTPEP